MNTRILTWMWMVLEVRIWLAPVCLVFTQEDGAKQWLAEQGNVEHREYCLGNEPFEAQCLKNEVILMNHAMYGRMRISRCLSQDEQQILKGLKDDPQAFGCSVNVIGLFDQKCSGRNRCEVRNTDPDLQNETPCYKILKSYLEADYECVTVIEEERSCHVTVSSNPLHILSPSRSKINCGTKSQPWIMEAPSGQQISVNLFDFSSNKTTEQRRFEQNFCRSYGSVIDKSAKKNISICGRGQERKQFVYKSLSNLVEIQVGVELNLELIQQRFLLQFVASGCSDLIPPVDAWLRRKDNEATVGCYTTRRTWHLRCTDNHWVGVMGNCSGEMGMDSEVVFQLVPTTPGSGWEVIISVNVAIVGCIVCFLIICCGAICWKRYNSSYIKNCRDLGGSNYKHTIDPGDGPKTSSLMIPHIPLA